MNNEMTCAGWQLGKMQALTEKMEAGWGQYGNVPSRLPPELRERHTAPCKMVTERARNGLESPAR